MLLTLQSLQFSKSLHCQSFHILKVFIFSKSSYSQNFYIFEVVTSSSLQIFKIKKRCQKNENIYNKKKLLTIDVFHMFLKVKSLIQKKNLTLKNNEDFFQKTVFIEHVFAEDVNHFKVFDFDLYQNTNLKILEILNTI